MGLVQQGRVEADQLPPGFASVQKFMPAAGCCSTGCPGCQPSHQHSREGVTPWFFMERALEKCARPVGSSHLSSGGVGHPVPILCKLSGSLTETSWKKSLLCLCLWLWPCCAGSARPRGSQGCSQSLPIWSPCTAHANEEGADSEKLYQDFLF